MQALITDLLDYSKIDKDKSKTMVDCNTLLKEVLNDMSVSIASSHAKVEVGALPSIYGFHSGLKSLFQNLISNAIKFHKPNITPEIAITAQFQKPEWIFAVKDNGIGI